MNIVKAAKNHKRIIILTVSGLLAAVVLFVIMSYVVIGRYDTYVFRNPEEVSQKMDDVPVGLILGGGIENGRPRPLLESRLIAGAGLLRDGKVRHLIVSGDNRFTNYNEPQVMKDFLVDALQVDPALIQLDNAGRSTYESCERASKIFQLKSVVLVSESTHLPRAIYLCRSFGIEAYGFVSDGTAASKLKLSQSWREVLARSKAILNVYVIGEKTVLGEPIPL